MPLKYVGAILIFLACGAAGFLMAAGYRKEERSLSELVRVLDFMSCELEYRLTPLPELCSFGAVHTKGALRNFFLALSEKMDEQATADVAQCVEMALKETAGLPGYVTSQLRQLGQTLGHFDLQGQVTGLNQCRDACLAQLEAMEHQQAQRLRSYQTLGFCAGAALAIILF